MNAKIKAIIITAALCLLLGGGFFAGFRVGYPAGYRAGTVDGAAAERRAIEQSAADRSGDISLSLEKSLREATERSSRLEGGLRGAIEASRGIASIVEQGGSRADVIERIAEEIDRLAGILEAGPRPGNSSYPGSLGGGDLQD
ncbi:hypothetical protein SDC9_11722 [bioreactor metagenome]|uniref:Uncharacterized protein n=1 Tax=bioreactor metagenome TaxID=1076179 RepID=A0A644TGS1_9ZZZZ